MKTYIGIDNGTTGSVAILSDDGIIYETIPTKKVVNYQKEAQNITRIDCRTLFGMIKPYVGKSGALAIIERPMVNPQRFRSSTSALRALEAVLIVLEMMNVPYQFIDSKQWQKEFLPPQPKNKEDRKTGKERTEELKWQSRTVGMELFPSETWGIAAHGDADGLLIAEWARRKNK